jgi:hypothetical protein
MAEQCWGYLKCGREQGGEKVAEWGVCPAYLKGAGQACWNIAGTFCGGEIQGTQAQKEKNCMLCDFYQQFDLTHRSKVKKEFGS